MITQEIDLNLIPESSPVIVHCDQYDEGTGRIIAHLYKGDVSYSATGTAIIQGTKPDGKGFQYDATLNGNTVTANLTKQMTACAGRVRTQIVVTESSGRTGTFVFILDVQKSALPSDTDMSASEYQLISQVLDNVEAVGQEAISDINDAIDDAEANLNSKVSAATTSAAAAEAWAVGTHNGESVPSTDPAYNNHARYWAGQAEQFAQGGLIYKGSIAFANIPTSGMKVGDMYNITDDFTTDSRFQEGAGKLVKAGTNIAWNANSKWDAMVALGIDSVPTQNSTNLITSGGVWSAIDTAITQVLAASY